MNQTNIVYCSSNKPIIINAYKIYEHIYNIQLFNLFTIVINSVH